MAKTAYRFLSADGRTEIVTKVWEGNGVPRGIVQLVHGMVEFIDRYDEFANFLTDNGFIVVGNDLLGHGDSVVSFDEWGYLEIGQGNEHLLSDVHHVRELTQSAYGIDLPYFIFGHSMGSFIVRYGISRYASGLSGAVICGTGQQPPALCVVGNVLARFLAKTKGPMYRSTFLNNLSLGSYNKKFEPGRTPVDWLSKDGTIVDAYAANPKNNFIFTVSGYAELTRLIKNVASKGCFAKTPDDLPLLIMSGACDPVGDFGKAPKTVSDLYVSQGSEDVTLVIYPDDRHEILNELDREKVYGDVLAWLEERVSA